jgi:hypothetical protein
MLSQLLLSARSRVFLCCSREHGTFVHQLAHLACAVGQNLAQPPASIYDTFHKGVESAMWLFSIEKPLVATIPTSPPNRKPKISLESLPVSCL